MKALVIAVVVLLVAIATASNKQNNSPYPTLKQELAGICVAHSAQCRLK